MKLLEKIWILINILIILIIILSDSKNSNNNNTWLNQFSNASTSISEVQKFIYQLNWVLIGLYFLTTVGLSYSV
jgi:preprotein translocase subunit SecG